MCEVQILIQVGVQILFLVEVQMFGVKRKEGLNLRVQFQLQVQRRCLVG